MKTNKQLKLKVLIDHQSTFFFEKMSWGWKCPQGWKCLRAGNVSGPDFFLLILGPDMSQGRKCIRPEFVPTCLRAGLVSGPEMSQGQTCLKVRGWRFSLGPEVSRGRKCPAAGSVLELVLAQFLPVC